MLPTAAASQPSGRPIPHSGTSLLPHGVGTRKGAEAGWASRHLCWAKGLPVQATATRPICRQHPIHITKDFWTETKDYYTQSEQLCLIFLQNSTECWHPQGGYWARGPVCLSLRLNSRIKCGGACIYASSALCSSSAITGHWTWNLPFSQWHPFHHKLILS